MNTYLVAQPSRAENRDHEPRPQGAVTRAQNPAEPRPQEAVTSAQHDDHEPRPQEAVHSRTGPQPVHQDIT